jgi:RimJ/RimL family protein N-acetyltransferase
MRAVTPHLVLRDFANEDVTALHDVESDAEAVRYQSYAPKTLEDCRAYLARDRESRNAKPRTCFDLAVTDKERGKLIGRVGLEVKQPELRVGELWFILRRDHWGRGLMTEAAGALMDMGFDSLHLHRIYLECDPRNLGACRLAQKLGMEREAHLRQNVWVKDEWCDSLIYARLA